MLCGQLDFNSSPHGSGHGCWSSLCGEALFLKLSCFFIWKLQCAVSFPVKALVLWLISILPLMSKSSRVQGFRSLKFLLLSRGLQLPARDPTAAALSVTLGDTVRCREDLRVSVLFQTCLINTGLFSCTRDREFVFKEVT